MKRETHETGEKTGLTFVAEWLLGPVLIWVSLAVFIVTPFPVYTEEGSFLHWANFALAGSLLYYLIRGPRLGAVY